MESRQIRVWAAASLFPDRLASSRCEGTFARRARRGCGLYHRFNARVCALVYLVQVLVFYKSVAQHEAARARMDPTSNPVGVTADIVRKNRSVRLAVVAAAVVAVGGVGAVDVGTKYGCPCPHEASATSSSFVPACVPFCARCGWCLLFCCGFMRLIVADAVCRLWGLQSRWQLAPRCARASCTGTAPAVPRAKPVPACVAENCCCCC